MTELNDKKHRFNPLPNKVYKFGFAQGYGVIYGSWCVLGCQKAATQPCMIKTTQNQSNKPKEKRVSCKRSLGGRPSLRTD
jgi:hypothetical protein